MKKVSFMELEQKYFADGLNNEFTFFFVILVVSGLVRILFPTRCINHKTADCKLSDTTFMPVKLCKRNFHNQKNSKYDIAKLQKHSSLKFKLIYHNRKVLSTLFITLCYSLTRNFTLFVLTMEVLRVFLKLIFYVG